MGITINYEPSKKFSISGICKELNIGMASMIGIVNAYCKDKEQSLSVKKFNALNMVVYHDRETLQQYWLEMISGTVVGRVAVVDIIVSDNVKDELIALLNL